MDIILYNIKLIYTWAAINSSVSIIELIVFSWWLFWFLISSKSCIKSFRRTWLVFRKSIVCFTMPIKNCCTSAGNVRSFNALKIFGKNIRTIFANAKDAEELSTAHPILLNSDCESFSELHSSPNAHVPITSVVNLAVRSRISNSVFPELMVACKWTIKRNVELYNIVIYYLVLCVDYTWYNLYIIWIGLLWNVSVRRRSYCYYIFQHTAVARGMV